MAGPTLFRPDSIPTGLQGYWKLDEASGSRADSSGNGNTLTDNNTVTSVAQDYWKTGESSAYFVSGNSEYLSLTDASQTGLDLTGDFSIGGFIKPTSLGVYNVIFSKHQSSAGIIFFTPPGDTRLNVIINGSTYASATGAVAVGKNSHVMCVKDTSNNRLMLYVDGNLFPTSSGTSYFSSSVTVVDNAYDVQIGKYSNSAAYSDAYKKDIAVWNVALTPIQVKSLVLGVDLSTLAYRPDSVSVAPTAWWKFNELGGNRADSSGNGHTLTDNNTVLSAGGYIEAVGADFEASNNEYLSSTDHADYDFSGGVFSVAVWLKPESLASDVPFYSNFNDGSNFFRIGTLTTGAVECVVYSGGSPVVNVATAVGAVKVGALHHVVVTEDGDTWKIYVDGVDATASGGTDTSRAVNYTGALEICRRADASAWWDGVLSDLAIWKGYALTSAEVASLACGIPLQQTGLVSYFKLDEASGTRVDSIGANNLTDNNTVLSDTGKVGDAADFEASNSEYLSLANNDSIDIVTDLSILGWVKPESVGITSTVLDKDYAGDGYGIVINTSNKINFYNTNTASASTTSVSAGAWSHFAGIYTGSARELWFNSKREDNDAYTTNPADVTSGLRLGSTLAGGNYVDGLLDELLIAKRWFRNEEIKTIYNKGLNGKEVTSEEIGLDLSLDNQDSVTLTEDSNVTLVNLISIKLKLSSGVIIT